MEASARIPFLVDEHLPVRLLLPILQAKGHRGPSVLFGSEDAAMLTRAEDTASVVVTADRWYLDELLRYPPGHRRCYSRAGVVKVPGVWAMARRRITDYLPIVEAVHELRRTQPDQRVAIDLSQRWIRIFEP